MSGGSSVRWCFVRHLTAGQYTWLWQRVGADGRIEKTSEPYPSYGKVLAAALQNGFQPSLDYYSMDLPSGRMHFPPARVPEFVSSIPQDRSPEYVSTNQGKTPLKDRATKSPPMPGPTTDK